MAQDMSISTPQRRRTIVVGAVVATAAVLGLGAWTLAPREAVSRVGGPALSIAVVAPVEPVPEPGSILEVGTLSDGFDRAALDRRPEVMEVDYMPPDAYAGEDWPDIEPMTVIRSAPPGPAPVPVATVTTTDPLADGSRLFGFDRRREPPASPSADYQNAAIQSAPAKSDDTFFE